MKKLRIKKARKTLAFIAVPLLFLLAPVFVVLSFVFVETFAENYVYDDVEQLPDNNVGLVLGTSKYLAGGGTNLYFDNRMIAATNLYKAGKIKKILVSGDNKHVSYNEPREMWMTLVQLGIPAEDIYMDFAGFRTLDSVIRCKKVFGQQSFTIISQDFHNKRAVFIARALGINAIAYNAEDLSLAAGTKVQVREWLARSKALLDVYVLHSTPKFLGERIQLL